MSSREMAGACAGGRRGVVAAGHGAAAAAAAAMLDAGGTAADAAVAAWLAACVAEPLSASLGGAGLAVVRGGAGVVRVYDFFAHTPRARSRLRTPGLRRVEPPAGGPAVLAGLGAVAVPAVIPALFALHGDLGRMPLAEVAAPALALAREGVEIDAVQARMLAIATPLFPDGGEARALLAAADQNAPWPPPAGSRRSAQPALADVLDTLVHEGPDLYRRGEIGQRLVAACAAGGGHVTAEDLRALRVPLRPPLTRCFRGVEVHLPPPPAHGGALAGLGLDLLAGAPLTTGGWGAVPHRAPLAEALLLSGEAWQAARDEDRLDPAAALLIPERVAALRAAFAALPAARAGTTHIAVIDAAGRAVSLSLTCGEGAGEAIPGTGILLNNLLSEAESQGGGWPADTRLSAGLAPLVAVGGEGAGREGAVWALGAGGGRRIPGAVLQVLVNALAFALPPEDAIARPRLHVPEGEGHGEGHGEGRTLHTEDDLPAAMADAWRQHRWPEPSAAFGAVWAAVRDPRGHFAAAADPRRPGAAAVV